MLGVRVRAVQKSPLSAPYLLLTHNRNQGAREWPESQGLFCLSVWGGWGKNLVLLLAQRLLYKRELTARTTSCGSVAQASPVCHLGRGNINIFSAFSLVSITSFFSFAKQVCKNPNGKRSLDETKSKGKEDFGLGMTGKGETVDCTGEG